LTTETLRDPRHCVIGPGRVGSAVLASLSVGGAAPVAVGISPNTEPDPDATPPRLPLAAALVTTLRPDCLNVLWLTVPDDTIRRVAAEAARTISERRLPCDALLAVHLSGLGRLCLLAPLTDLGATPLSLHPLQSFARRPDGDPLADVPIAVTAADEEGEAVGRRLAVQLGGHPFALGDDDKPLYHLAAVTAANLFVALEAQAADLLGRATGGDPDEAVQRLGPLVTTTLRNLCDLGPAGALTGPVARGDIGTVREHLALLRDLPPRFAEVYRSLSLDALSLAAPRLDDEAVAALHELLGTYADRDSTATDASTVPAPRRRSP